MVVSAAVVGTVGSIGAAAIGSKAASSAARQQANAANVATQTQKAMFDQTQQNSQPFIDSGQAANNLLQSQLPGLSAPVTMDQATLQKTPGYQFALNQGLKSTQNAAAARGLGTSGAALKGAAQFATGLADQTYQNQFENALANKQASYDKLFGATQLGANAAQGLGTTSANVGNNISNSIQNTGNALASGTLGSANAINKGIQGATSNTQSGLLNQFYANKIIGEGNSSIYEPSAADQQFMANAKNSANSPYTFFQ